MDINLATYAVRTAEGNVDSNATVSKFAADLDVYIAERETEQEVIANAVMSVFDDLKAQGTRNVNVPYVLSQALVKLNITAHPNMFMVLNDRVHAYLSENSQGKTLDKATGKVERPDSLFVIGRGKGPMSGIQRRSDLPAQTPAQA